MATRQNSSEGQIIFVSATYWDMAVGSLPGNSGNLDLEQAIQKLGPHNQYEWHKICPMMLMVF